jgi:opacity protein-like surface antigen
MRRSLCVVVFTMCAFAAFAQDAPKAEIFGGFSYGNYELLARTPSFSSSNETISGSPSARLSLFGWNGSIAVHVNPWFSFATDVSGYYSGSAASTTNTETITNTCGPVSCPPETITTTSIAASPKIHNFLFGPQFSHPVGKVRPFVHFLVGGEHSDITRASMISSGSIGVITSLAEPIQSGTTEFAMAIGGGVDYSIKRNLAVRLATDYLTNQGTGQNHVRVSTGLVWRLGH